MNNIEAGNDKDLIDSMQKRVDAVKVLEAIDEKKYQLAIQSLADEWYGLKLMAEDRGIETYPEF